MSGFQEGSVPIQPWPDNPAYWMINDQPVLLLGGSVEDNLFQINDLETHLDQLKACGGNYVRCTMSSRDEGDVWPFFRDPDTGLYDLERAEGSYWDRFERFIELTRKRGIILQIEVFDRFDFAREPWRDNPFNPGNNSNYDTADSGLEPEYDKHPGHRQNPFFRTPPALESNARLRRFQEIFVNRLMEATLGQPHVLYCISNETNESPEWGAYWAKYIRAKADATGHEIFITEMWDDRDLEGDQHRNTYEHPELYDFVDISQVNHQSGQKHWDQLVQFRKKIAATGKPRPLNTVKIYGANSGYYGTTRDAQERFWQNIFAGLASTRFHRPPIGLGLSPIAQANLRSARMLANRIDLFACHPDAAQFNQRSRNEAYCTGIHGKAYAIFFPDGGNVVLNAGDGLENRDATLHWLEIRRNQWHPTVRVHFDSQAHLALVTPSEEGYWACVLDVS